MVDMEVVELARRAIAAKAVRVGLDLSPLQQGGDTGAILRIDILLDAVGAEARHPAGDEDLGLVERIAEVMIGIAADDERAALTHEQPHITPPPAPHTLHSLPHSPPARPSPAPH